MAKKAKPTATKVELSKTLITQAHALHTADSKFMSDSIRAEGVQRADVWADMSRKTTPPLYEQLSEEDGTALAFVKEAGFKTPSYATLVKRVILYPDVVDAARKKRDAYFDDLTAVQLKKMKTLQQAFWSITAAMADGAKPGAKRFTISDAALKKACLAETSKGTKPISVAKIKAEPAEYLPAWIERNLAGYVGIEAVIEAARHVAKPETKTVAKTKPALPAGKVAVDADIAALTDQIARGDVGPVVGARRLAAALKKAKKAK